MNRKLMIAMALAGLSMDCSGPMQNAGGSSDSGNPRVVAVVHYQNGSPAIGVVVRLRKSDYVSQPPVSLTKSAVSKADTVTDEQGRFEITGIDPGAYSIEVNDTSTGPGRGGAVLFTCSIDTQDTVNFLADTLRSYAEAHGMVDMSTMSGKRLMVQVDGLERLVPVDSTGGFILNDLPAGHFRLHVIAAKGTQTEAVRSDSVSVAPGDTVNTSMPGWKFVRKVNLNTTSTGANVAGHVLHFPVCIRLTKSNFDFGLAKGNGEDIRFSKADYTPIPFEIEQWDSTGKSAAVWVLVDTVFGNNGSQYILMYWGNANSAGGSNSADVFDAADGYVGVWHQDPGLRDATINADNGIDSSTGDTAGLIGRCRSFDPLRRSFITIPNAARFNMTTNISLSAWVLIDQFKSEWQTIIAKGDNTYRLHCDTLRRVGTFSISDTAGYEDAGGKTFINDNRWHLITGVFDGSVMKMYTDGNLDTTRTVNMPAMTDNMNLTIGDNPWRSPRFFAGSIDEVRVMHAVMSADWVKLCYMNQKETDALIVFR